MIVHVGQPSPLQFGHSLRGTNSARSVGIGMSPRRCEMISSNSGATLSYSFPSSARIGPRWNSTSSIAIFGTSARSVRRSALTSGGVTSSNRTVIEVGADARTFTFTLHAPPAAAALRFRAIVRYRRHILNPANSQACPCEAPDRRLGSGSRGLRLVPAGGTGTGAPGRAGWRSCAIGERGSYTIVPSSPRLTRYPGTSTRRPDTETWPCTMNCRAWRGVKARPFTNVKVWRRRERTASTSSARTSSRAAPSSGRSPSRPRRARSSPLSFSACGFADRTNAWSCRARWRNLRRTDWAFHSSLLFFSPYFFRSSFSALIRSPSHGCEGRVNMRRENFGSPNRSLLLLFLSAALFLLRGLRGGDGSLLDDADGEARAPVASRPLPANLLPLLVADSLVAPDHLHPVDVVAPPEVDLRTVHVDVRAGLPIMGPIHNPSRDYLSEVPKHLGDFRDLLLREVPDSLRTRHGGEVRNGLCDAHADALDAGEGVNDGPLTGEVRIREADDEAEVLLRVGRPLDGFRCRRWRRSGLCRGRARGFLWHGILHRREQSSNGGAYIRLVGREHSRKNSPRRRCD